MNRPVFVLCLCLFINLPTASAKDPVYTPQTLNDSVGNSANNESILTWDSFPEGDPSTTIPDRYADGLKTYFNIVHSFINSVFSKGFPEEIVQKILDGKTNEIISQYSKYLPYFIGCAICVAVGVLFTIIFPIVACCFCCCRCCGRCGGNRYQEKKDAQNLRRKYAFASILLVAAIFLIVGAACLYIDNESMSTALISIPDNVISNVNDIKTFVNNTIKQANRVVVSNLDFAKLALFRDLDNIGYLVGIPFRKDIEDSTNITVTLTSAYAIVNDVAAADAALAEVENNVTSLKNSINDLTTALNNVKQNLDVAFNACSANCAASKPAYQNATANVNTSTLPDLSSVRTSMNNAKSSNLSAKIADAEAQLNSIPDRVVNDSLVSRNDFKSSMENVSKDLDPIIEQINNVNNMISGENATVDLDMVIDQVNSYRNDIKTYDKYRWYGGVGLASIVVLVVAFALLGLAFGVLGTRVSTAPSQRGCVSNCGGIMLMVSASLILIFSFLLMLLTFPTFMLGSPIQAFVCNPLTDLDELEKLVTIYNDHEVGAGKYMLGKMLFQNDTIALTVSGILRDCQNGKSAYDAFKLATKFDIYDLLNYSKVVDVQAKVDAINVDLTTVNIYPTSLQAQISDIRNAVDVNFTKFYLELNKSPTTTNLTKLADDLDAYASNTSDASAKSSIHGQATELRRINSAEYIYVGANITQLNGSVAALEAVVKTIPISVNQLADALNTTDAYIKTNGSAVFKTVLTKYAHRLTSIMDSFINFTLDAVTNEFGNCKAIWNVYNSLLIYTFCYNFVDLLNGFWFSLGWCIFFFMPTVIFSVKLAKYFRRMNPNNNKVAPEGEPLPDKQMAQNEVEVMPSKAKFWMKKNKIQHYESDW